MPGDPAQYSSWVTAAVPPSWIDTRTSKARMTNDGEGRLPLQHTVGIDVSKARLDAHRLPDGEATQFANTKTGFRQLIKWSGDAIECIAYSPILPLEESSFASQTSAIRTELQAQLRAWQGLAGEPARDAEPAGLCAAYSARHPAGPLAAVPGVSGSIWPPAARSSRVWMSSCTTSSSATGRDSWTP